MSFDARVGFRQILRMHSIPQDLAAVGQFPGRISEQLLQSRSEPHSMHRPGQVEFPQSILRAGDGPLKTRLCFTQRVLGEFLLVNIVDGARGSDQRSVAVPFGHAAQPYPVPFAVTRQQADVAFERFADPRCPQRGGPQQQVFGMKDTQIFFIRGEVYAFRLVPQQCVITRGEPALAGLMIHFPVPLLAR